MRIKNWIEQTGPHRTVRHVIPARAAVAILEANMMCRMLQMPPRLKSFTVTRSCNHPPMLPVFRHPFLRGTLPTF